MLRNSNPDLVLRADKTEFNRSPNYTINITTAVFKEPVGKQYTLENGQIIKKELLGRTNNGTLNVKEFNSVDQYVDWLKNAQTSEMRLCGNAASEHDGKRIEFGESNPEGTVSLTNKYLSFRAVCGVLSCDTDYKEPDEVVGLYPHEMKRFESHQEITELLRSLDKALVDTYMVCRDSSSSFISNGAGELLSKRKGIHTDIIIDDSRLTPAVLQILFDRLWLAGYGWAFVDKGGRVQLRAPIDLAMMRPHQPDFLKASFKGEGQSTGEISVSGTKVLKASDITPLTQAEQQEVATLKKRAENALAEAAAKQKEMLIQHKIDELVSLGVKHSEAKRQASGLYDRYQLEQDMTVHFCSGDIVSVGRLLIDGHKYDKQKCYDPLEPDYPATTWFFWNNGKNPLIFGYAHGGSTYFLKENAHGYVHSNVQDEYLADMLLNTSGRVLGKTGVHCVNLPALYKAVQTMFFVESKGRYMTLNPRGRLIALTEKYMLRFVLEGAHHLLDDKALQLHPDLRIPELLTELLSQVKLSKKERSTVLSLLSGGHAEIAAEIISEELQKYLVLHRQVERIQRRVDMFAEDTTCELLEDGELLVTFTHISFEENWGENTETVELVWNDYKEHWPDVDQFLEMMLAARFATDRRQAFVWMNMPSDWGKGLLMEGVLKDLGLVIGTTIQVIEKAFNGAPLGLDLSEGMRAWVLFVDEWKKVSSEIKMLNSELTGAAKNQLNTTVPLYLKVFASAENVAAMSGDTGVETQFANRFMKLHNDKGQMIKERPVFKSLGKFVYVNALKTAFAKRLNQGVDRYVNLGRDKASKLADEKLEELHTQFGIANDGDSLDEYITSLVEEMKTFFREAVTFDYLPERPTPLEKLSYEISQAAVEGYLDSDRTRRAILIRRPTNFIERFIELTHGHSDKAKVGYKRSVIRELMDMRDRNHEKARIYDNEGKVIEAKGLLLNVPKQKSSIASVTHSLSEDLARMKAARTK
jgi:hypothetical protein